MKKTKKLLACLIAAATMFTMGSTAFAAEAGATTPTYTDKSTVTIKKAYKLTNAGTKSPEETFTLVQDGDGTVKDSEATSVPKLGTIMGAKFAEGAAAATVDGTTGNITVALPTYEHVGIYTYTLKEVNNNTAGVTYYENDIKLVVTVINDGNGKLRVAAVHTEGEGEGKNDTFTNTYSAGKLNVTKEVTGNLGDKNKKFDFAVTFKKPEGKNVKSTITATIAGAKDDNFALNWDENGECKYTFKLAHKETATFDNLPYGVTYTVTETATDGYTTTKKGETGSVAAAEQTAAFTNNKTGEVDTGVNLTTLPYILVFAGVIVIAGAAFITRRRKFED